MLNQIKRIFKSVKPQVFNIEYKIFIKLYSQAKEICTKKPESHSCNNAVDKLDDYAKKVK